MPEYPADAASRPLSVGAHQRARTDQAVAAYTRTIHQQEVTFTCVECGCTRTQIQYPGGRPRQYCNLLCAEAGQRRRADRPEAPPAGASSGPRRTPPNHDHCLPLSTGTAGRRGPDAGLPWHTWRPRLFPVVVLRSPRGHRFRVVARRGGLDVLPQPAPGIVEDSVHHTRHLTTNTVSRTKSIDLPHIWP